MAGNCCNELLQIPHFQKVLSEGKVKELNQSLKLRALHGKKSLNSELSTKYTKFHEHAWIIAMPFARQYDESGREGIP